MTPVDGQLLNRQLKRGQVLKGHRQSGQIGILAAHIDASIAAFYAFAGIQGLGSIKTYQILRKCYYF